MNVDEWKRRAATIMDLVSNPPPHIVWSKADAHGLNGWVDLPGDAIPVYVGISKESTVVSVRVARVPVSGRSRDGIDHSAEFVRAWFREQWPLIEAIAASVVPVRRPGLRKDEVRSIDLGGHPGAPERFLVAGHLSEPYEWTWSGGILSIEVATGRRLWVHPRGPRMLLLTEPGRPCAEYCSTEIAWNTWDSLLAELADVEADALHPIVRSAREQAQTA